MTMFYLISCNANLCLQIQLYFYLYFCSIFMWLTQFSSTNSCSNNISVHIILGMTVKNNLNSNWISIFKTQRFE